MQEYNGLVELVGKYVEVNTKEVAAQLPPPLVSTYTAFLIYCKENSKISINWLIRQY